MLKNKGATALLGAAASAWMIYDMTSRTEQPSATLATLEAVTLGLLLISTVYSAAKWFVKK